MKTLTVALLPMLMALCATSAPKFFPYCVTSSPAELKALGYDGCEIPFVTGDDLTRRIKEADEAQMVIAKTYISHDVRQPFPLEKLEAFMAPLKGRELVIELVLSGYPAGAPEGIEPIVKLLKANPEKLFMVGTNGANVELKGWGNLICPLDVGDFDNAVLLEMLGEIKYTGPVGLQCYGIKLPEQEHLKRSITTWKKLIDQKQ